VLWCFARFHALLVVEASPVVPDYRRSRILAALHLQQRTSVNELATQLDVSRETIRRDLTQLENGGLLRKVHGGAVPMQTATEPALQLRAAQHRIEKHLIGERAARLFRAGDSLFVDAGSTTTAFATALAAVRGITVITNSLDVALRLGRARDARVHLLGGVFKPTGIETVGAEAIEQIATFHPDYAVLTVGAIDEDGNVLDFDHDEAMIARAMIGQARSLTLLADNSKFGRPALMRICQLREVSRLVTDRSPPKALWELLRAAETEVIIADGNAPADGNDRTGAWRGTSRRRTTQKED
jgi:DeoR family glycerol-3-phosphate regulon repressor